MPYVGYTSPSLRTSPWNCNWDSHGPNSRAISARDGAFMPLLGSRNPQFTHGPAQPLPGYSGSTARAESLRQAFIER